MNKLGPKSYELAIKIIGTYKELVRNHNEYSIFKQLLRSGTSVGANIQEAIGSISKKEFGYKCSIAYKEARETKYWVRLLVDCDYLEPAHGKEIISATDEICKMLYVSIRNARE